MCGIHSLYYHACTYKAIKKGKLGTVKRWLEKRETKVNECRGGTASHGNFYVGRGTALHWAAYYGQLEIANLLLENGAGSLHSY